MKRLIYAAVTIASWLLPHPSFAQGTDVGISGVGLLAIQPIDDAYVGSPYLSEGIGGFAPGFGAGLSIIAPSGMVVAAELTTARYTQEQSGRLIEGCTISTNCVAHTTTLHDSILSGLIGYAHTTGNTRMQFVGGIGVLLDSPAIDGDSREASDDDHVLPFVPTGGFDVLQSVSSHAALVFGAGTDMPRARTAIGILALALTSFASQRVCA